MIPSNTVYKALTRPSIFMGVPITPFLIVMGINILLAMWFSLLLLGVMPFSYLCLRLISKIDEKIFSLIGLKRFLLSDRLKARVFRFKLKGNYYSNFPVQKLIRGNNDVKEYQMLNIEQAIKLDSIIPYSSHLQNDVIITKNGCLLSTWIVEGLSYFTRSDESLERFKNSLNTSIKSLATENVSIYIHCIRDYVDFNSSSVFDLFFANIVNEIYKKSFDKRDFMKNTIFISLVYNANKKNSLLGDNLPIKDRLLKFNQISAMFESYISKYNSYKLSCVQEDEKIFSQQMSFYNFLLSGEMQKISIADYNLSSFIGNCELLFVNDIMTIKQKGYTNYVQGIEIKDWVAATKTGILDTLLSAPCKFILTQSFTLSGKTQAKSLIDKQIKQLKSTEDDGVSQLIDLEEAKDELVSGNIAFGEHHFSLILFSKTEKDLKASANLLLSKLIDEGFVPTLSNIAFEESFFAQLPANLKFRPRTSLISSLNFADLNSLHNNQNGKQHLNCWGEAVTILKTQTSEPFYFNFHQTKIGRNDFGEKHLGHTLFLGKSGSGKTAIINFLLCQMTQYMDKNSFPINDDNKNMTVIYFDKDYGAEATIKALNGNHSLLKKGKATGFNPFLLSTTEENIFMLVELMEMIAIDSDDKIKLSSDEKKQIHHAVNSVMNMPIELRSFGISRFVENIQKDSTDLRNRFKMWTQGNIYGWVFDNEKDTLDFNNKNIFGFDGTEILDQKSVISPISFYLINRIMMIANGRRLVIIIDEFWKWLQGDAFRSFVYDGLKTLRKRNAILICATQSPDEILKSDISRAIIEQTESFIFLPNDKASKEEYMKYFECSEKEYSIVKNLDPSSRQFLIKKGNQSEGDSRGNTTLVSLDLSYLGKLLKILSLSTDNVDILREIIQNNPDPKIWINLFLQKCV